MTRLPVRLLGLALWLSTKPANRMAWAALDTLALGRWALAALNAVDAANVRRIKHDMQQAELAARHAKPSSRKRIR